VAEVVAVTAEGFGGGGVLVNNAGLPMGRYNLTSTLSLQEWRRLFDADLFGAVRSRPGAARKSAPQARHAVVPGYSPQRYRNI